MLNYKTVGQKNESGTSKSKQEINFTMQIDMSKCRGAGTVVLRSAPSNSPRKLPTVQGIRLLTIGEVLQDLSCS